MRYMLLINNTRENWEDLATWSPEEIKASTTYMGELLAELTESGEFFGGEGLGGPARMKIVRAQPGADPLVTDLPMAETKEILAGYIEVDVASLERAIEIAERVSAAPGRDGTPGSHPVEVHPITAGPDEDPLLLEPYRK